MAGAKRAVNMLRAFAEDLDQGAASDLPHPAVGGKQVFVVHGRNEEVREKVARLLERLGLEPIILHEQTDKGRTVIEKFEDHALEVGYAVILLTPDDFGRGPDEPDWPEEPNRARQNVILEMGYFMGALGRNRTAAIYVKGTNLPSDIHGMIYIPLDRNWELQLAKEMRGAGLPVDLNRL
jgi:predicted nucleotide-binding protein